MNLQILYADTLFLSNLVMNLLALSLTGGVMHLRYGKGRLIVSSVLGGLYSVFAVVFSFQSTLHIVVGVFLSALLVLISFGGAGQGGGFFLRAFLLFYFSSVLLGGGIEALFSLLEGLFGMRNDLVFRPADAVLAVGFGAYFILRAVSALLCGGETPHSVSVRISWEGRSVTLPLLVDSGCRLTDPITGKCAVIVSANALRGVLPSAVLNAAGEKRITIPKDHSLAGRCRLMPMRTVGEERLLLAFRPSEVLLLGDGGSLDVWVALATERAGRYGGCSGLFPANLLYGRTANGKTKKVKRTGGFS